MSNESIGVVAVSLWEPMRLHLSWPRRDRDCGCGMLRSSQLRGDPVPNVTERDIQLFINFVSGLTAVPGDFYHGCFMPSTLASDSTLCNNSCSR